MTAVEAVRNQGSLKHLSPAERVGRTRQALIHRGDGRDQAREGPQSNGFFHRASRDQ